MEPITIDFELTRAHYLDYASFAYGASEHTVSQMKSLRLSLLVIGICGALLAWLTPAAATLFGGLSALMILIALVLPPIWSRLLRQNTEKMLDEQSTHGLLGPIHIELHEDALVYNTTHVDTRMRWEAMTQVRHNEDYVFVYIGAMNAFIVPKSSFSSPEQLGIFMQKLYAEQDRLLGVEVPRSVLEHQP